MTPDALECAACGHVGYDVHSKIVESDGTRDFRVNGGTPGEVYTVPERYRREPRCADKYACQERQERASA